MSNAENEKLQALLQSGIDNQLYSCAQLVVAQDNDILASYAVGKTRAHNLPNDLNIKSRPINTKTLFDVASLTKPLATASLMMKAIEENRYALNQKLVSIDGILFPPYLLSCTIAELLSHQTLLPAWYDFHGHLPRLEDHVSALRFVMQEILKLSPRDDAQTWCYSDLGYMLLGMMLEMAYEKDLNVLFENKIAVPLHLEKEMMYVPLERIAQTEIPATCAYKGAYIQGHPDDANARAMTHIAGHAGLFANAEAIAAFTNALISGHFPVSPAIVQTFLTYKSDKTPFALGWDRPTSEDSLSGRKPGDPVIGHLGFTGCSVWIDLETHRTVTFLTNRTHVNQEPKSLAQLRRDIHHICWNL